MGAHRVGELGEAAMLMSCLERWQVGPWRGAGVDLPEIAEKESASVIVLAEETVFWVSRRQFPARLSLLREAAVVGGDTGWCE